MNREEQIKDTLQKIEKMLDDNGLALQVKHNIIIVDKTTQQPIPETKEVKEDINEPEQKTEE